MDALCLPAKSFHISPAVQWVAIELQLKFEKDKEFINSQLHCRPRNSPKTAQNQSNFQILFQNISHCDLYTMTLSSTCVSYHSMVSWVPVLGMTNNLKEHTGFLEHKFFKFYHSSESYELLISTLGHFYICYRLFCVQAYCIPKYHIC